MGTRYARASSFAVLLAGALVVANCSGLLARVHFRQAHLIGKTTDEVAQRFGSPHGRIPEDEDGPNVWIYRPEWTPTQVAVYFREGRAFDVYYRVGR